MLYSRQHKGTPSAPSILDHGLAGPLGPRPAMDLSQGLKDDDAHHIGLIHAADVFLHGQAEAPS